MSIGPLPPVGTDVGSGNEGEDPRNTLNLSAAGAGHENSSIELKEVEGLSLSRVVYRRFLRHRAAMISLVLLVLVLVLSLSSIGIHVFGINSPGWWRWGFDEVPRVINGGAPTLSIFPLNWGEHPFGQDSVGHDMFAAVMRGIQQSLMIVFVTGLVSTIIGAVIGAVAGYFGGFADALLMRFTDMIIIIPLLLLAAIVGRSVNGPSVILALLLGFLVWTTLARLVRGEVLALREREFVDAARVAGASSGRIMFRHILPNTVGVIVVSATLTMSATILLETAISYLGFGVHAPDTSLGLLIAQYQTAFTTRPWLFWWPGLFIVIVALTINFIGDGLRDAFDPRQRRGLKRSARLEKARLETRNSAASLGTDA